MTCRRCQTRPVPECYGSPRRCAFDDSGAFTRDNWACETMRDLRTLRRADLNTDNLDNSITTIPTNSDDKPGWIILAHYKRRGAVDGAVFVDDDGNASPLTVSIAELAIGEEYQR